MINPNMVVNTIAVLVLIGLVAWLLVEWRSWSTSNCGSVTAGSHTYARISRGSTDRKKTRPGNQQTGRAES